MDFGAVNSTVRYTVNPMTGRDRSERHVFHTIPGLADWIIRLSLKIGDTVTLEFKTVFDQPYAIQLSICLDSYGFRVDYVRLHTKLIITKTA